MHAMNDPVIRICNLHKRFGDLHVVKGVDLEIGRGERPALESDLYQNGPGAASPGRRWTGY